MLETPRTCILIHKKHNSSYLLLQEYCSRDLVAVKFKSNNHGEIQEFIIGSAYFPHDKPSPTLEVQRLVLYARENNYHLVLGCDANSHHIIWNSTNTNQRGEELLDFVVSNNLLLPDQGNRPTFITVNRKEVLDITMCTQHFVNSITKWEVLNEPSMADHQHISFKIVGTGIEQATYRDPRRTDWTGFRQTIVETIGPVNTNISGHRDLDEYAEHLQNSIKSSYETNNTPIVKTFKGKARRWNKTLAKMRANVRKLFRIAMKYNVWAGYRSALNEYNIETSITSVNTSNIGAT
ncbi:hypothetical protein M8J75_011960 [Diaphorina citri]|nr:hypothetical protein M8J75_011960 [Diaphorina citri]